MPQSPPTTPTTTHSPLLFAPQVPVVPLQRPDDIHVPSCSWMETTSGYEDMYTQVGIPTMITWSYDGKEVAVEGSWDNWKTRMPLQRSGKDFALMRYFRLVFTSTDLLWMDARSTLQIRLGPKMMLGMLTTSWTYSPEDIGSISSFEPPQSPDSSYDNLHLSSEDYAKEPPLVPPLLQMTLLNVPATNMEIQPPMSRPRHGVLNHLYTQKGKSSPSVAGLGTTHRFLAKYVTVVLYKSLQSKP
ncbi:hypothetical protein AAZX31_07G249100 [Glycine max]|uniref:Association with the SNF1 complex (ASC) domain-containing protein n=2 Tax=Glycine subgen. Soja TaxID=1462606 RepID=K7L403_SOYBN|nr:SNF1-related protein kinase regulatory subunit beta-2-like [Glycine max]KAH1088824.1 hypothetical protein GYH30_019705 [Glycine max]KHN42267.1 SNF1-related protein kinase regulatory subunit beta-2 [Glycine soja]KRH51195.1 hypothetical protein GLYMA_07G267900v4 [Glycine max]RZC04846.1 SNF1-related protein kinase regulatory subunit beta-2 isoform A [Glycine soja]